MKRKVDTPSVQLFYKGQKICVYRSEQWEWTAYIGDGKKRIHATGATETTAERNLLRKLVYGTDKIEPIEEHGE